VNRSRITDHVLLFLRLDYFLKVSRIVKRRPLAKEMCDKKLVQVNDQIAKAGKEVNAGDIITVKSSNRVLKVRVEQVPQRAISKKDASELFTILEDRRGKEEERLS
jgi:ribosomal 50S subunit-recycling heat shock protein